MTHTRIIVKLLKFLCENIKIQLLDQILYFIYFLIKKLNSIWTKGKPTSVSPPPPPPPHSLLQIDLYHITSQNTFHV